MKCPLCKNQDLSLINMRGIEIESCPVCFGVWLEKEQLDEMIDPSVPEDNKRIVYKASFQEIRDINYFKTKTKTKKGFMSELCD